ncbi:MAG: DUF962 domain-containing protein [Betaproteobacteria bacterium]|nr:DUF962 domain-containing protein [Betaproteobacteria bacterium]NBT09586.1 DUF962 domain-containing protein [Betaproteobacteria bacterium]NBU48684.1 DUF962 domain-containing protein [Betaproteobacteria bacterium]NBX96581.1 DUF962 domain-containing protein [Betaproteobacteria bacterium]
MRDTTTLLVEYARYHRDPRNIATHLVGIPLIVLGIGVLLSQPAIPLNPGSFWVLTPAWALWAAAALWYLTRGGWLVTSSVIAGNGLLMLLAHWIAVQVGPQWLAWGAALFLGGWVIQFIGHYYEGRKPAFMDDLIGLLVGPMFVCAELLFALRLGRELRQTIETEAGPTRLRDLHAGALR